MATKRRSVRGGKDRPRPSAPRGERPRPADGVALGFHAVRSVLQDQPRRVDKILLARDQRDGRTRQLVRLAREAGVPFLQVPKAALDRLAEGVPHQGVAARLSGADLLSRDELIERMDSESAVALVADGITDPRNLGAILRSAAALGASGLFIPTHRSAGITPGALRSSAGTAVQVPVARSGNSTQLLERLERAQFWSIGLSPGDGIPLWEADLTRRIALVIGGEEKGLRPGLKGQCDQLVTIPMRSEVESLNVSVAVGIVLAERARQLDGGRK